MPELTSHRSHRYTLGRPLAVLLALCALVGLGLAPRGIVLALEPQYSHLITVDADGVARTDKVVEVGLNFTPLLSAAGGSGAIDANAIRVYEIDGNGDVIDNDVPFQFDRAGDYHAGNKARGTLVFLMTGNTGANETRHYRVFYDVAGSGFSLPAFTDRVSLTDSVGHKGYPSIRVVADGAEYFYHKPGGGFATLLDAEANDWIDWNTANGGLGDFRGIPNMVHPNNGGYFHPGRNSSSTVVLSDGPLRASFRSTSNGGDWQVVWDVYPTYARMTVVKTPSAYYWFLYEGVPGGELVQHQDFMTRSNGDTISATGGNWSNDIPGDEWVFASDEDLGRSLYFIHHQQDTKIDGYYADLNRMTVFGFGRNEGKRYLNGVGRQFTIGFVDAIAINDVRPVVNNAYKPLAITGANDDGGGGEPGPTCEPQALAVYISPKAENKKVDGILLNNEDVVRYDATTCEWEKVFDGTEVGIPAAADVDALALKDGDYYFSFLNAVNLPGAGKIDDSDVVKYDGSTFTTYFDGSIYGLTSNAEDVDAIAFDETGALLLSTLGTYGVPGLPQGGDEDLLRLQGGSLELRFDGSKNAGLANEDVAGASVTPNGNYHLSVLDGFNVGGISGNTAEIFTCASSSLGALNTNCTYGKLWNATAVGLPVFDAFEIE